MRLADGNQASVGDVIISRRNDRRVSLGANDWLENGDRWMITHVTKHGDLTVRHNRSQITVRLPIDYVRTSTGLGYAATIHAAQGVAADTMHDLLTGQESRQQLSPTASIPKTRGQPEEASSIQRPPCGNSDSTGRSPIPPIHQTTQGPTNDSEHTPHTDVGTMTGKAIPNTWSTSERASRAQPIARLNGSDRGALSSRRRWQGR